MLITEEWLLKGSGNTSGAFGSPPPSSGGGGAGAFPGGLVRVGLVHEDQWAVCCKLFCRS